MAVERPPGLLDERESGVEQFDHHCSLGYAVVADLQGTSASDPIDQMALGRAVRITQIFHPEFCLEPIHEAAERVAQRFQDEDTRYHYFEIAKAANKRTEAEVVDDSIE